MKTAIGRFLFLILLLNAFQPGGNGNPDDPVLKKVLKEGEAYIWYLGHAGWAIKTKNHLLIFDYVWVPRSGKIRENPSLADGYIYHAFDGIPEAAFLVRTDGLAIFHSGDHSRTGEEVNNGDIYTIEKLGPKVTFPMHQGGGERFYEKFAQEARQKGAQTHVICAKKQGDRFFYQKGKI